MISRVSGTDFQLDQNKWQQIMDSTMKIKNNNNLKEFSIINLRINLFFNLKKA